MSYAREKVDEPWVMVVSRPASCAVDDHTQLAYDGSSVEFIEAPLFTRILHAYLTDDQYADLQRFLADDPEAGDVIPGTGGFRKLRWADPKRGQGRRGACGSSTTSSCRTA